MSCRHEEGAHHDCAHVDWRDSLVPVAAAVADAEVPAPAGGLDRAAWGWRWDAAFHRAMARLAAETPERVEATRRLAS